MEIYIYTYSTYLFRIFLRESNLRPIIVNRFKFIGSTVKQIIKKKHAGN